MTSSLEEAFDEVRDQFEKRRYVAGLLLAYLDLVDASVSSESWPDADAFLNERRVQNTKSLTVYATNRSKVSLRSKYEVWLNRFRNEHGRGGYPSGAPQAVGSWETYVHWLDAALRATPEERASVRRRVEDFVLEELPVEAPSQKHGRPLDLPNPGLPRTTRAKLVSISLERFKSYDEETRIELAPLTVILGRNNSGKSSIIQSLLLLKQTLADPRAEVPIRLEGLVDAFHLRELTFGWPPANGRVPGPVFTVEWDSEVDVEHAFAAARHPDRAHFVERTGIRWAVDASPGRRTLRSGIRIETADQAGTTILTAVTLTSPACEGDPRLRVEASEHGAWSVAWKGKLAPKVEVEMEHFLPHLSVPRSELGPRDPQRAWFNAFLLLWDQPLADLNQLLTGLQYLGSTRQPPPSLYRPATVAPQEIGVSGEFAAQLLHRRQHDVVHYLPPLKVEGGSLEVPDTMVAEPLTTAVNHVLADLGVQASVSVQEVQDVGFRLLFGSASLQHVGRGLTYLLPIIELGLLADPLGAGVPTPETPQEYRDACSTAHLALEEPEAHLHPKVQSRLAQWLVSLAMANRQLIVETHSDHLVRRLRGMVARAAPESEAERWLLANVLVIEVEQDEDRSVVGARGPRSLVRASRLTREGGFSEAWPADFMDEARDEDSAIFDSGLAKSDEEPLPAFIHDEGGDEPEEPG